MQGIKMFIVEFIYMRDYDVGDIANIADAGNNDVFKKTFVIYLKKE